MIRLILKLILDIGTILVGMGIMLSGIFDKDYTRFGVGLLVIHLPTLDRIDERLAGK